jgi:hypothetical protein
MKFETDIQQTGSEDAREWSVTITFDRPVDDELFEALQGCRAIKSGRSTKQIGAISLRTESSVLVRFEGPDGRENAEAFLTKVSAKLASMAPKPPDVV